jgi:hypothetical protein
LTETARTAAASLRAVAESFMAYAPENGFAMSTYQASQPPMSWLCR